MPQTLNTDALDQLFRNARTFNKYQDRPVDDATLKQLYELYKWGPTAMNCQPGRVVFVRSNAAKEKLKPALMGSNVEKTMHAPVTAIVATDTTFYEQLPTQFPANPKARDMFATNQALAQSTGLRSSTLQGAYLILAARALGLDAGPMSGFNAELVNQAFFAGTTWTANFLINLGYGDASGNYPRGPRLPFNDAVRIA